MDLQKEREAFEDWYCKNHTGLKQSDLAKFRTLSDYSFSDSLKINIAWEAWQAAKAQALPEWISVEDKLPSDDIGRVLAWVVEQNSLGKCGFAWNCSHSNGVFSDKFETFQVTHWMPLPDAPQEQAND